MKKIYFSLFTILLLVTLISLFYNFKFWQTQNSENISAPVQQNKFFDYAKLNHASFYIDKNSSIAVSQTKAAIPGNFEMHNFYFNKTNPYSELSISYTKAPITEVLKKYKSNEFFGASTSNKNIKNTTLTILELWQGEGGNVHTYGIFFEKNGLTYVITYGTYDDKSLEFDKIVETLDF